VYWTCIVAREDSGLRTLRDTLSRRMAYTTTDSQSGYQAMRALVASEPHPFSSMIGPLVTPRRVVEAVLAGDADAGPVDSYALDLMRLHEPALVAPLRVVATTPPTPIPLRDALTQVGDVPALAQAREAVLLRRFEVVDATAYDVLRATRGNALV
jgi:ABC-type phosphate/phosphonate transport system substrate-binding protein